MKKEFEDKWWTKQVPRTVVGEVQRECKFCGYFTTQVAYETITSAWLGIGGRFGRRSTKGKVGKKAQWLICQTCGDLIPRDIAAVEWFDKQGTVSYPGIGLRALKLHYQAAMEHAVGQSTEYFAQRARARGIDPATATKADIEALEESENWLDQAGEIITKTMHPDLSKRLGITESQVILLLGRMAGRDDFPLYMYEPVP